jgi:hypothetical protein
MEGLGRSLNLPTPGDGTDYSVFDFEREGISAGLLCGQRIAE